jgi:hypothetical protein
MMAVEKGYHADIETRALIHHLKLAKFLQEVEALEVRSEGEEDNLECETAIIIEGTSNKKNTKKTSDKKKKKQKKKSKK